MDFETKARQDKADQKLILSGGENREQAIANIYSRYAKDILGHYCSKGLDLDTAEELMHDVFIKILQNREKLVDVDMLGPWIWKVVFNNKVDYFRKKEVRISNASVSDENLEHHLSYTQNTDSEDFKLCVEECFKSFADKYPKHSYALRLSVKYGWTPVQLAFFLDLKTNHAASEFIYQSRKKIQPCMQLCRED